MLRARLLRLARKRFRPRGSDVSNVFTAYSLAATYSGSRDYTQLAELACADSIICIVDYEGHRDIARTNYMRRGDQEMWSVSARGIGYITAFSREDFISLCNHRNLEFIMPPA